jgi:hypothetical protein
MSISIFHRLTLTIAQLSSELGHNSRAILEENARGSSFDRPAIYPRAATVGRHAVAARSYLPNAL